MFKVYVPFIRDGKIREVTYPPKGHTLYTREQAEKLLDTLYNAHPIGRGPGEKLEPWAESDTERFTRAGS
jgi:hypothetical protein